MRIYFLSSRPCALKVGGVFFGRVDDFERFADIDLTDSLFLEFIPEKGLPLSFFLTEEVRFTPPKGCEVYLLEGAIALYARDFPPDDFLLRPIAQISEKDCLATLFQQGEVQLSLQSQGGFRLTHLPPCFAEGSLSFEGELLFCKCPAHLAIFTKSGERVFLEKVLSYRVEEGVLEADLPLVESLGRIAKCRYSLTEKGCERVSCTLLQARGERLDELLPLAFFETLLFGGEVESFLCEELQGEGEKLKEFLGEFLAVYPVDEGKRFLLIRKKAEGLFEGAYYTVKVENGEIIDITT